MLLHLSGTASASHTDILQSTAKAGCLMSLEVAETDKNICVHDSMADQGSFTVFSVHYRNFYFIGSSNSVTDDDLTSGCDRVKSIKICTVQMLQCVLSTSRIKGITICQEPVSYTHLDVYKRQLQKCCHSTLCVEVSCCYRFLLSNLTAVSYTHLDVYKRQG